MKKINISLFVLIMAAVCLSALTGCKWNLSDTKYLERPDVNLEEKGFQIRGSYVNKDTKYINIYRQETFHKNAKIERVAVLFPEGNDDPKDQTYIYKDKNVYSGYKYRYYVRFVTSDGEKNRTDWTEPKAPTAGVAPGASFAYTVGDLYYVYDSDNLTLTISDNTKDFTPPAASVISDISEYKPALVLEAEDKIQTLELVSPNTTKDINLKTLIPQDFYNKDIKLLGIVGQKVVKNSKGLKQYVTWTDIASINIKDTIGKTLTSFKLESKYGAEGFDYTIKSDNEN